MPEVPFHFVAFAEPRSAQKLFSYNGSHALDASTAPKPPRQKSVAVLF